MHRLNLRKIQQQNFERDRACHEAVVVARLAAQFSMALVHALMHALTHGHVLRKGGQMRSGGHQGSGRGNEGSRGSRDGGLIASARTARVGIRGQPRGNSGAREMRQGTSKWGDSAKMFTGFEAAPVILETQGRFFIYRDASGLFQKRLTTRQSLSTNTH